jgi:UDP-2,3-diacylglucosamine pyrophosphatase LpxH
MPRNRNDIDDALASLTDAKDAQDKIRFLTEELRRMRHRKPVAKISANQKQSTSDTFLRVIIPDSHGNLIDREAAGAFLSDLARLDPEQIIMLGDHLNCGGFLSQHLVMGYVAEIGESSFADDVEACNLFLDEIIRAAPRAKIKYMEGNHEVRIERWCVDQAARHGKDAQWLLDRIGPQAVLCLAERGIEYFRRGTVYDGLHVAGMIRLGGCLFTHGFSTAESAAAAHVKRAGRSIVYGHTHRSQTDIIVTAVEGELGGFSPGCLAKKVQFYDHNKPNNHTHGYGVQVVERDGSRFFHTQVPIIGGKSLLRGLSLKDA